METQPPHPTGILSAGEPVHVEIKMVELVAGKGSTSSEGFAGVIRDVDESRSITLNPKENPRLIRRIDVRLGARIIASVPMAINEGYWMYVPPAVADDDTEEDE